MAVPFDLIVTDSFYVALGILASESPKKAAHFEGRLEAALRLLEEKGPGVGTPHGLGGDKFAVAIDEEYVLVFRWATDRDGQGHPLADHLWLLTIERQKPTRHS